MYFYVTIEAKIKIMNILLIYFFIIIFQLSNTEPNIYFIQFIFITSHIKKKLSSVSRI